MTAKITFFPVGNGDMTLIVLESGRKILIDVDIRSAADDEDDDTPDVAEQLRDRLTRDSEGRLYVDAFLLSHPDKDHCTGFLNHFHVGLPEDWSEDDDKIVINEMWSSPMVFRRASKTHTLCDDAKAFNKEARRRVEVFRDSNGDVEDGDRILILGEDQDGKTDDLQDILIKVDEEFSLVNGEHDDTMVARLLAPHPKSDDDAAEDKRAKNHSSTILNFSLTGGGVDDAARFLTGGDAEVAIWEMLWGHHKKRPDWLAYNILQTPHHCSWHSLSYDSWSGSDDPKVCEEARKALAQARDGAIIVASSDPIKDDDCDPPCIGAKDEYEAIASDVKGTFKCVGEHPSEDNPDTLEIEIGADGPKLKTKAMKSATVFGSGLIGKEPLGHG